MGIRKARGVHSGAHRCRHAEKALWNSSLCFTLCFFHWAKAVAPLRMTTHQGRSENRRGTLPNLNLKSQDNALSPTTPASFRKAGERGAKTCSHMFTPELSSCTIATSGPTSNHSGTFSLSARRCNRLKNTRKNASIRPHREPDGGFKPCLHAQGGLLSVAPEASRRLRVLVACLCKQCSFVWCVTQICGIRRSGKPWVPGRPSHADPRKTQNPTATIAQKDPPPPEPPTLTQTPLKPVPPVRARVKDHEPQRFGDDGLGVQGLFLTGTGPGPWAPK